MEKSLKAGRMYVLFHCIKVGEIIINAETVGKLVFSVGLGSVYGRMLRDTVSG